MKSLKIFAYALLFVATSISVSYSDQQLVKIVSVIDGDTIRIADKNSNNTIRVRLYGIDAPESKQAHGKISERGLKAILGATRQTYIEFFGEDRYGRRLGVVHIKDVKTDESYNVNEFLVKRGLAWVYDDFCSKNFCEDWKRLEAYAKQRKFGLWKSYDPIPPWEWRKQNKK